MITVKVILKVINDCSPNDNEDVVITPHLNYLPSLHFHISMIEIDLFIYEEEYILHTYW